MSAPSTPDRCGGAAPPAHLGPRSVLRFVWQIDEDDRFTLGSDEFLALVGSRTAAAIGRPWSELAATLALDPGGQVARAIATHETWSGLTVWWPLATSTERLAVELSGLPVFDRDRMFRGYRGFGLCRDVGRLVAWTRQTDEHAAASQIPPDEAAAADNVVSFPATSDDPNVPYASPIERGVFRRRDRDELERLRSALRELNAILETAADGVVLLDQRRMVLSANRSAQALFGYQDLAGRPFTELFAPECLEVVRGSLDDLERGREVIGRTRQGDSIPLFMTMGWVGDPPDKLGAVFRDITRWKKAEGDLLAAKRQAENASSAKSDFLAKISHEIRIPLNAIIGFSEVMMEERLGPIGNERYREYLKDMHASGGHLLSLINDLLDLSKIEAGMLELTFTSVVLNDLVQQCVAIMQPQANRERVIIGTSLAPALPQIVADARSVRQIVFNLLSNSIKFTAAGGQVTVSTARSAGDEVVLRVRDTGIGMSEKDIVTALEPFRQLTTAARTAGTGLGLPLTKALVEANRATFSLRSAPNEGTLVEIAFPATRVLAG
jgi:PAS domain S-box-containing protein